MEHYINAIIVHRFHILAGPQSSSEFHENSSNDYKTVFRESRERSVKQPELIRKIHRKAEKEIAALISLSGNSLIHHSGTLDNGTSMKFPADAIKKFKQV